MRRTARAVLGLALSLALGLPGARAGFLYVDPSGITPSGQAAYTTIQAAVNAAPAGGNIVVDPGTYNENVTIGKQGIALDGAEAGVNAAIRAAAPEPVLNGSITVTAPGVPVNGFTVNANAQWAIEVGGASSPSVAATNGVIRDNIANSSIYGIQIGAEGGPGSLQVPLYAAVLDNYL